MLVRDVKRWVTGAFVAGAAATAMAAGAGSASASPVTTESASGYVNIHVVKYWSGLGDPWAICNSDAARSNAEQGRNPDGSVRFYCTDAGDGDVNLWERRLV
ncbi:hypothetical protein ACGH7X_40955 [Streptomyces sp. BBFR51]|uniref:hypothetical protein n=1 Tax=Streptomyces sp. BBFR51 TaxID=3372856 RepID=UPI0037DCB66C